MEKEETAKKEKKTFKEWYVEHPKTVFAIRLVLWSIFSAVLPFAFIAWRYGIFTENSGISLSGWGFIGIIVLIVFAITLFKYLYKGMKPGFLKQCITGFVSVILPLLIAIIVLNVIKKNIEITVQALVCVLACEIVAVPLDPFPEWLERRAKEQGLDHAQTLSEVFWDTFFKKKKDNE